MSRISGAIQLDDEKLIEQALESKPSAKATFGDGATFSDLWENNIEALQRAYPDISDKRKYDFSSADAALATRLAFWTGKDCERMMRLMLGSKLVRPKWERPDYLRRTILNACASCHTVNSNNEKPPSQVDTWQIPHPLPSELLPVKVFDLALLPESLQPWVADIVERVQCPPDFVGVAVMVCLGALIGRRVGIRPKQRDDWTEYCNLWGCVVGRPGVMKSPALAAATAPLKQLQAKAQALHDSEMKSYEVTIQVSEMRRDAHKKKISKTLIANPNANVDCDFGFDIDTPILRRYFVNDATAESLMDICIENPSGTCAYRDELVSLLKSLDREGQESARGFFLTGWNGNDSYSVDRVGRGRNMRAEAVCLSMLGSTQPGRISEYLRAAISGGASDDGLIQRFSLLVWPDVGGDWVNVDRWPDTDAKKQAFDVFESLDNADPVNDWLAEIMNDHKGMPETGKPPFLRLDSEAAEIFLEWRTQAERELRCGNLHPAMESHLSKYRKLVPSMALICHLADGGKGSVTVRAMRRALAWAVYLRSHAERSYGAVTLAELANAKALIKRIRSGDVIDGFTARDVYIKGWSMLSKPEEVSKGLYVLIDYGWIRGNEVKTDGKSKMAYSINPNCFHGSPS